MQHSRLPDYRVYVLDRRGHFIWAHEFSALNDKTALERAMTLDLPYGGEIWQQARKVGFVSTPNSAVA
ncbi:MAG TPA: hypothetical protein VD906_03385 [Caulobacteraceae bacterium]|nr:hypothetical protein [Caulobacteraceae bacterium]